MNIKDSTVVFIQQIHYSFMMFSLYNKSERATLNDLIVLYIDFLTICIYKFS